MTFNQPWIMDRSHEVHNTLSVIYDGECAFCIRSLKIFRALDFFRTMSFFDFRQKSMIESRFPMLQEADLENAMHVVTATGRIYAGFFAFRRMILNVPFLWILLPLFYFPGVSFFGTRIYSWVARNRTRLGCGSDVCKR